MFFKEKLLLSNCDSVRQLQTLEIKKRFLTGLVFGDGLIITPNILIDNRQFRELLQQKNVIKYLNEEGAESLIIRGFNISRDFSLEDYFFQLPDDHIFSSIHGCPRKSELTNNQEKQIINRLLSTQAALEKIQFKAEAVDIFKDSLLNSIRERISDDNCIGYFFETREERLEFIEKISNYCSRSEFYAFSKDYFNIKDSTTSSKFNTEIIDPAYNSLFAKEGEGFMQDSIKFINNVPEILLETGVSYKSLRNELKLLDYAFRLFQIVTTLGSSELYRVLTEQSLDYIESKATDKGHRFLSRKNWFGMYDKIKKSIGLEIK